MARRVVVAGVASGLACMAAIDAAAQNAPAPASAASAPAAADDTQKVIVTAQKRKEDIRKVPLSVSVMSGEALQENQVSNFTDLSRNIPNVSFTTQAGAGLSTIEIRGVSSQAGTATASIYLDDVSLTTRNLYSQGTAEPRFFDIDRVEVLRGPQGTLYGASALGGTIKFISKQPDPKAFGGYVSTEVSGTSHGGTNYQVEGVLNVPLGSDSALRVGVQSGKDSGYIDRVDYQTLQVLDKGINSAHWDVLKLALKTDIVPGWSFTPAVFAQRYKSDDIDAYFFTNGDSGSLYHLGPNGNNPNVDAPLGRFQTSKDLREPSKDRLTIPSLTVNGDLGFADFTGIVSGYQRRFDRIQDGTLINSTYIGSVTTDPVLGTLVSSLPSAVQLNNKVNQTSLELRLASKDYETTKNPITWVAGIFTAKTKTEVFDNEPVFGITQAFLNAGHDVNNPADLADTFPGAFTGDSSYYSARHYDDKQNSVFGEITYHFSPSLRAIAGVRVLHASQHFTREGDFYYAGGPTTAVADGSWNSTTPRFALSWDVNEQTSLFANVAKGFRLGSANRPVPLTPLVQQDLAALGLPGTIPAAFNPDSLWSYEIGSKSQLWDRKLTLNVTAFYIDWKDIQQDVTLPSSGFDFETNVGRAKSYGLEFEARARLTNQFTLNAAAGFTRAVFSEDVPALGDDGNGNLTVKKGDRIQGVPSYNLRLGFDYHFQATDAVGAVVRLNGQWTGSSRGSLIAGDSDYDRPSYFTADASASFNFDRWDVSVFVKNLTNNHTVLQKPSIQGVIEAYTLRPRTIGVGASYTF